MFRPKRPKNTKTRKLAVAEGYRSGLEKSIADDLKSKEVPFEYEEHTISYALPVRSGRCGECGSTAVGKRATYTPDFRIPGGIFVESKGYLTARARTKLSAVRSQHPEIDLRLLFSSNNWCTKLHRQRYSGWAIKHGFIWAVGKVIPADWLAVRSNDGAQK